MKSALECEVSRLEASLTQGREVMRALATLVHSGEVERAEERFAITTRWVDSVTRPRAPVGVLRCGYIERWPDGQWFVRGHETTSTSWSDSIA